MNEQKQARSTRRKSMCTISSMDKNKCKNQSVPSLYSKFLNVSNKIEIEHDVTSLNIIDENDTQIKAFDDNLGAVKLKQIQNKNQLLRAEAQLFKQRKVSRTSQVQNRISVSPQLQRFKQASNNKQNNQKKEERHQELETNKFKTIEKGRRSQTPIMQTLNRRKQSDFNLDELQQELNNRKGGILYLNQLKKHPKILNYTIERFKMKTAHKQREAENKMFKTKSFAEQLRNCCHSSLSTRQMAKNVSVQLEPSQIVEIRMRKIYSKQIPRKIEGQKSVGIDDFIEEQQKILESKSKQQLSKQGYTKLKEKLDNIAYQINACRKRNFKSYTFRSRSTLENRIQD